MAYSINFERRLQRSLEKALPGCEWETEKKIDNRSNVDVAGSVDGRLVLVEVELKKDNPVENTVKIWHWRERDKTRRPILFIQAFSAHYASDKKGAKTSKAKQYERAVFIGRKMAEDRLLRITYKPVLIFGTTRKGKRRQYRPLLRKGTTVKAGGGAMLRAAGELARDIAYVLSQPKRKLKANSQ